MQMWVKKLEELLKEAKELGTLQLAIDAFEEKLREAEEEKEEEKRGKK